jgi:hypothetical protein
MLIVESGTFWNNVSNFGHDWLLWLFSADLFGPGQASKSFNVVIRRDLKNRRMFLALILITRLKRLPVISREHFHKTRTN